MIKLSPKINPYLAGDNDGPMGYLTSPVITKGWRLGIFHNRATSNMLKSVPHTNMPNPKVKNTEATKSHIEARQKKIEIQVRASSSSGDVENGNFATLAPRTKSTVVNRIVLIDTSTSSPTEIEIQGKPRELSVAPESTWATVKSAGRNNPFMFYTGGEDIITFEISWYAKDSNPVESGNGTIVDYRQEVIDKCRLIESWSRADGYSSSPPLLKLSWGNSNLFEDDLFVLTAAPYQLSNFQNSYRNGSRRDSNAQIVDLGLAPNCARQQITLKRVTSDNRTHNQIRKIKST